MADNKEKINFNEIAVTDQFYSLFGNRMFSTTPYNPSLLISTKGFGVIDKMRRDDQIKAAMAFKKNSVIATGWEVASPQNKDEDWEVRVFVENVLKSIEGSFERKIMQILTALDYGFSITEKVWSIKNDKIVLKNIKTKKPHQFTFNADQFGNLLGLNQNGKELPLNKFIVYSYESEFDNHYGTPDLESAYRAWWTKDNSYKWFAMLLERLGIPPIFAMYDKDAYKDESLSALKSILRNLQAATTAAIPTSNDKEKGKSIDFWSPELAGNVGTVFIPALEMLNRDIARAILMPNQLGVTPDDKSGSYARAIVNFDVFMLVVQRIRDEVQEHIVQEQIIKPLVDLNFVVKEDEYPQFKFMPLTDDLRVDILDTWQKLTNTKVVKSTFEDEAHIRKSIKFPKREKMEGEDDADIEQPAEDDIEEENKEVDKSGQANGDSEMDLDSGNDIPNGKQKYSAKLNREKNQYEKHIDFAAIDKKINGYEIELITKLRAILLNEQNALTEKLKSLNSIPSNFEMKKSVKNKLISTMKKIMLSAAKEGRNDILKLGKYKANIGYITAAAEDWVANRAGDVAGILFDKLNTDIKIAMSNAVRSGIDLRTVIAQIQDLMLPYIGNDNVIEDDEVLEAYRVESIVRTNMTQAYNQGKLAAIRDPDIAEYIHGVEYSAILDNRTTDICQHLDGKVFKVDDPDLDRLTPPNHFNALAEDTLINTESGLIPIQHVKVGDKVLTHSGKYKKVYAVMCKKNDTSKINRINVSSGNAILVTDEHPILTCHGWVRADNLKVGDNVFQENVNGKKVEFGFTASQAVLINAHNSKPLIDEEGVSYEIGSRSAGMSSAVNLKINSINNKVKDISPNWNLEIIRDVCFVEKVNKLYFRLCRAFSVSIRSGISGFNSIIDIAHRIISNHFGGMNSGQFVGCFNIDSPPMVAAGCPDTISGEKASPFRLASSINAKFNHIFSNGIVGKTKASLNRANRLFPVNVSFLNDLFKLFSVFVKHIKAPDWIGVSIVSIAEENYNGMVYNLAVEDDETYVASGIVVHNCRSQLVPIMIDQPIDKKDLLNNKDKGTALDLAGKGFV